VTNPALLAPVAVRLSATALALVGIKAPVIWTSMDVPAATGWRGAPRPLRVSKIRVGGNDTNRAATGAAEAAPAGTEKTVAVTPLAIAATAMMERRNPRRERTVLREITTPG
jgi:hypothetical protein